MAASKEKKRLPLRKERTKKLKNIVLGLLWASAQSYARGNGL